MSVDPVGGSAPKFSSGATENIATKMSSPLSLTCPAQGAPKPQHRYKILKMKIFQSLLEVPSLSLLMMTPKIRILKSHLLLVYFVLLKDIQSQVIGKRYLFGFFS